MAKSKKRKLPIYLNQEEADKVLATALARIARAKTDKQRRRAQRDWLVILTGILTGLRVSELCKLQISHLDFSAKMLQVVEGKGSKDRVVPISEKLVGPLREWIGSRTEGYVFAAPGGGKLATRTLQDRIPEIAREAGVAKRITPHKMRHTFCTRLHEKGVDLIEIKDLAGHASVATTQIYTHASPEQLRGAVDKL